MPVQRIPRYNLLLRDLAKHTWPEHPDYKDIHLAASEVDALAKFLEEKNKVTEDLLKMTEISTQVRGIPLTLPKPNRRFVRETPLPDQRRTVFLFNNLVLVACQKASERDKKKLLLSINSSREEKLVYLAHLSIAQTEALELAEDNKLQLRLISSSSSASRLTESLPTSPTTPQPTIYLGHPLELQFLNEAERKEWLEDFQNHRRAVLEKAQLKKKTALQVELRTTSKSTEKVLRTRRQRGNSDIARTAPDDEDEEEISSYFVSPSDSPDDRPASGGSRLEFPWSLRKSMKFLSGLAHNSLDATDPPQEENMPPLRDKHQRRRSWSKGFGKTPKSARDEKEKNEESPLRSSTLGIPDTSEGLTGSLQNNPRAKRGSIIRFFTKS